MSEFDRIQKLIEYIKNIFCYVDDNFNDYEMFNYLIAKMMYETCLHMIAKILNEMIDDFPRNVLPKRCQKIIDAEMLCHSKSRFIKMSHCNSIKYDDVENIIGMIEYNDYALKIFNDNFKKADKYILEIYSKSFYFFVSIFADMKKIEQYNWSIIHQNCFDQNDSLSNNFVEDLIVLCKRIKETSQISEPWTCKWSSPTVIYKIIDHIIFWIQNDLSHSIKIFTKKK
uniref:Uncharacterized protein n=1 Tax=viral metagenome TaxID=1070528 RepID=A0A6C0EC40_9ZZZZ